MIATEDPHPLDAPVPALVSIQAHRDNATYLIIRDGEELIALEPGERTEIPFSTAIEVCALEGTAEYKAEYFR